MLAGPYLIPLPLKKALTCAALSQDERVRGVVTEALADWIERVLAGKWKPTDGVTTSRL